MEIYLSRDLLYSLTILAFFVVYVIYLIKQSRNTLLKFSNRAFLTILFLLLVVMIYETVVWFAIPNYNYYQLHH
jgi:hypothetical protein